MAHLDRAQVYFILFFLDEESCGDSELTTEGQYPNSSRNSSGFRTTDSDHILSAAKTFPSSASAATGTTMFTWVSVRELAPPRPLRAGKRRCLLGRRGERPSTRSRYACHVGWEGRNGVTARREKKVCGHARAKNLCRVFGLWEPSFTDVTSASCLSWLSANPAWRVVRRDHRQPSDDKSCSWLNSLEKRRRGIRAADECTRQESKRVWAREGTMGANIGWPFVLGYFYGPMEVITSLLWWNTEVCSRKTKGSQK